MAIDLIEELRALLAKATPGPWRLHLVDDTTIISPAGEVATTCDSSQTEREDGYNIEYEQMEADAALIVAMRNAMPALLDAASRIRALSAENEALWIGDADTRRAIGDRFCLVPPDGGDMKTWEAAAALRAENERLRKALEPFAKAASDYERQGEFFSNNVELVLRVSVFAAPEYHNSTAVQVGDLRRARSELEAGHE